MNWAQRTDEEVVRILDLLLIASICPFLEHVDAIETETDNWMKPQD